MKCASCTWWCAHCTCTDIKKKHILGKHISGKMQVPALSSPGSHRHPQNFLWEVVSLILYGHNFGLARKGIKSWDKQTGQPESLSVWISDIPRARIQKLVWKPKQRKPKGKRWKLFPGIWRACICCGLWKVTWICSLSLKGRIFA